jgi:glycosyltransferase involved in cell wall biosynthesis
MYPRKNHVALLRATALLRARLPSLEVRIVGDGPERARLERLAASLDLHRNVRFLGQVPRRALATEYISCDVFCLPTLQEGFGLVFAEAMTAGKPIVALNAGATPEIVRAGVGLLVEPGDDAALAGALDRVLADHELAREMGTSGRRAARERFGTAPAANRFVEAVRDLADRPPLAKFA